MLNNFKSCPVCNEQLNQCLHCASYVVNGERIYYGKLKDFGASSDSELRFIRRIQKHSTIAFFNKGELYIPSRQGRSVPLAIGLQWEAWQEQQKQIDELTVGCGLQRDHIKGLEAELKKAWTTVDQEGHKKHGLVMLLKFIKEHFEMNDLDKAMPRVYEELEQALKGGEA